MAISDHKILSYNNKDVASAPDVLTGSIQDNKEVFDALTKEIVIPNYNALVDELTVSVHSHGNKSVLDMIEDVSLVKKLSGSNIVWELSRGLYMAEEGASLAPSISSDSSYTLTLAKGDLIYIGSNSHNSLIKAWVFPISDLYVNVYIFTSVVMSGPFSTINTFDNQTISGIKTFEDAPIVPTPTQSDHAASKSYVDGKDEQLQGQIDELETTGVHYHSNKKALDSIKEITIGTSTSGHTAADCDYLCDGTEDAVEINEAISSLTNGGRIKILAGTYDVYSATASKRGIKFPADSTNITLYGEGMSTIITGDTENRFDHITLNGSYNSIENLNVIMAGSTASYIGTINVSGEAIRVNKCTLHLTDTANAIGMTVSGTRCRITDNQITGNAAASSTTGIVRLSGNENLFTSNIVKAKASADYALVIDIGNGNVNVGNVLKFD